MKPALAAICLVALALSAAVTFGDQKIDDAIRQAKVAVCNNTFTACSNQCSARASSAPGSYSFCMEDCSRQYQRCMGAISRAAAVKGSPAVTSHPSIAPPTPTPRKISPERVNRVSKSNASASASPVKSIDAQKLPHPSATATPRKN